MSTDVCEITWHWWTDTLIKGYELCLFYSLMTVQTVMDVKTDKNIWSAAAETADTDSVIQWICL